MQKSRLKSKKRSIRIDSMKNAKEVAPGLWINESKEDSLQFLDDYSESDFENLIRNHFGSGPLNLEEEELKTLISAVKGLGNKRTMFATINLLGDIFFFQNPKIKKIAIQPMRKAWAAFWKAVKKNGFDQRNIFPNFSKGVINLREAFQNDLVRYAASPAPYTLKMSEATPGQTRLKPTLGRGQPTSIMRDQVISAFVRLIEKGMNLKSRNEAVIKSGAFLKIIRCAMSPKRLRQIADTDYPDTTLIDPPSMDLIRSLLPRPS